MPDLSHSAEMGAFRETLERIFFTVHLLRQSDFSEETALKFLLLDIEALETVYNPVEKVIDSMI